MKTNILTMIKQADVAWKPIEEVFNIRNGYTPSKTNKSYWENGTIPWFRLEDIRKNGRILNSAIQWVNESGIKGNLFPANSIMMSTTATIGEHALITVDYLSNQQISNFSLKKEYANLLNMKFVFYYFFIFSEKSKKSINNSSMPSVQMSELKKWSIPIPPLELQKEIVKILDILTELNTDLTTALETEHILRKKQYHYYRDFLLSENELAKVGSEWKRLGEIGELIRGNGLTKKDLLDDGVPAIHYGQIYTYYGTETNKTISFVSKELAKKLRKIDCGDVVITNTSENFDDVGKALLYSGIEQAVTGGHATIFKPSQAILGKYFVYFTQSQHFSNEKRKYAKGTKVIDVSAADMAKITIPIPPLDTQAKIVAILDKFDRLTNSISDGLPKEIELRRKQYEYYRELLLGFARH